MRFFTSALAVSVLASSALAQGSGDTPCDLAVVPISGEGAWDYDTSVATTESGILTIGNPCASAAPPAPATADGLHFDRWFLWTAPASGDFILDTCSPTDTSGAAIVNYDTKIAVYESTGNCLDVITGSPDFVICGEDGPATVCANFATEVTLNSAQAGQDYWIQVGGWSTVDLGPSVLTIACGGVCASPFNDRCNGDGGNQVGCTNCPCGNDAVQGTTGGCLNQSGASARLLATGSSSLGVADPGDLRFEMTGGNPNTLAVLTSGDNLAPQNMSNPCFGLGTGVQSLVLDGLRCAVGNTQRHGGRPMDVNGDVGITNNAWGGANGPAPSIAAQGGFIAGQSRFFQVFYRADSTLGCLTGQNTTQAVSVTFQP